MDLELLLILFPTLLLVVSHRAVLELFHPPTPMEFPAMVLEVLLVAFHRRDLVVSLIQILVACPVEAPQASLEVFPTLTQVETQVAPLLMDLVLSPTPIQMVSLAA